VTGKVDIVAALAKDHSGETARRVRPGL